MKVILKNVFFANGQRYRPGPPNGSGSTFPVELPESLRGILPKSAVVVSDDAVTQPAPEPVQTATLKEADPSRAVAEDADRIAREADAQDQANQEAANRAAEARKKAREQLIAERAAARAGKK